MTEAFAAVMPTEAETQNGSDVIAQSLSTRGKRGRHIHKL